jgi:hypothetical protein
MFGLLNGPDFRFLYSDVDCPVGESKFENEKNGPVFDDHSETFWSIRKPALSVFESPLYFSYCDTASARALLGMLRCL